jgi:hypothetical protein
MRAWGLIVTAAVAAVCAAAAGGAQRERSGPCFPPGKITGAHSDSGRVYYEGHENTAVACLYRGGIQRALTVDDEYVESVGPWAISGRFVAYLGSTSTDIGASFYAVHVMDIKTGEFVREASSDGETCEYADVASGVQCGARILGGIVAKRNGSTAWIAAEGRRGVFRLTGRGLERLDKGAAIRPRSLRLSADRTRITWLHGDERRVARLP